MAGTWQTAKFDVALRNSVFVSLATVVGVTLLAVPCAYALARRWSGDTRFAFGTWKIEVLGAYASALVLVLVAVAMAAESVLRLVQPQPIAEQRRGMLTILRRATNQSQANGRRHRHGRKQSNDAGDGQNLDQGHAASANGRGSLGVPDFHTQCF